MALLFSPFFSFLALIISSVTACDRCLHQSKASFYSSPSSVSTGACGYGSLAATFNKGFVAAAAASIYGDGIGCGGCFQVRCLKKEICSSKGVEVIVTDEYKGNVTDLVLSSSAFMAMSKPGFSYKLKEAAVVDVEYKRVPCSYKKNLSIRVEEGSENPHNLTVTLLYQGGQTDLHAMDVAQLYSSNWFYMARVHGAVWSTARAPPGPLQFRFVVTGGFDGKWVWANREVLPLDWTAGMVYDTGVRITDVKQEGCGTCDADHSL